MHPVLIFAVLAAMVVGPTLAVEAAWKYHRYVVDCAARGGTPVQLLPSLGFQGVNRDGYVPPP